MKIAFKNFLMTLKRYKVASLLNVAGFTLAFVAFYVIASQVYYSLTYNRPLKDSDRTYLLQPCWEIMNSGEKIYNANSPQPASYETLGLCPEAEAGASLKSYPDIMRVWKRINDYHFEKFNLPVYNGNSSVVDLFGFKPVAGDLKKIAEPNTVIISASVASTMGVGVNDAIWFEGGYCHDDGKPSQPQTVVAIYEDFPKNTFLSGYNIIRNDNLVDGQHNGNWNYSFFVRMKKGADPSKFARIWEQQYAKWYLGIIEEYRAKYPDEADYEEGDELRPAKLTALKDMYYNVQEADSNYDAGSRQATAILATIGLIIVVIAFINFVNFFLALIPTRMRAINICKVFGAGQGTLRGNFIFEAVGLVLISMALALYLMIALQGSFISNYVSCSLALSDNLPVIAIIAVMMISFAVVAAVYPAFYITRFNASMAVKSGFAASAAGRRLRSVMVGMQFTVAMVLIIVTAVFFMQYRYMVKYDMGFSRNNIATFRVGSGLAAKSETLIERLTQYPDVQDVTASLYNIFRCGQQWGRSYNDKEYNLHVNKVRWNMPDFFGFRILEGNGFTPSSSERGEMIIMHSLNSYTGMPIGYNLNNYTVTGIMKDVMLSTVGGPMEHHAFICSARKNEYSMMFNYYVRLNPNADIKAFSDYLKGVSRELAPNDDEPEIFPLDEYVTGLYNATRQQMNIVGLFALLAIVIALMGVFGIVMIETQYRRTEIAVRKVYGATTSQMIGMLNRRYAIIVAACFLVAAPVAWYITSRWLEQFTRRIAIPWWIFAAALAAVLAITMALITLRSWRAASENPANVIKSY